MCRIIGFAIFCMAIGMLLMLLFRYRVFGAIVAVVLLAISYCVLSLEDK